MKFTRFPESAVLEHQLALRNLREENRDLRDANDGKDIQIVELQRQIEDLEQNMKQVDETVKEVSFSLQYKAVQCFQRDFKSQKSFRLLGKQLVS